jgi:metal-dependent hydrolase (beta-lactamase superfamily II)
MESFVAPTSLSALKKLSIHPSDLEAVFVSHRHADHFGGLPFLILDSQFAGSSFQTHQNCVTGKWFYATGRTMGLSRV